MEMIHWVALVIILIISFILIVMFMTGIFEQGLGSALSFLKTPV